jgi:hypothetical protein
LVWVSPPGDYAIVNSNHIPDGTYPSQLMFSSLNFAADHNRSVRANLTHKALDLGVLAMGQMRSEVLFLSCGEARVIEKSRSTFGRAGASLEEIVRTALRHGPEEIGKSGKAFMRCTVPTDLSTDSVD